MPPLRHSSLIVASSSTAPACVPRTLWPAQQQQQQQRQLWRAATTTQRRRGGVVAAVAVAAAAAVPRLQQQQQEQQRRRRRCISVAAVPPPMCFDAACRAAADEATVLSVVIPLLAAAAGLAWLLRRPPLPQEDARVFEGDGGAVFIRDEGEALPERDKDGLLAYRPASYTPWPVAEDFVGERVRVDVGPLGAGLKARTFVFERLLGSDSEVVVVSLPRPMGVVLEYDRRRRRPVVAGVVEGSAAAQQRRVAAMRPAAETRACVCDGDVLRALTCTTFEFRGPAALVGAAAPVKVRTLYGADREPWAAVRAALRRGDRGDGPVTLVLERRAGAGATTAAAAAAAAPSAAAGDEAPAAAAAATAEAEAEDNQQEST